MAVLYYWLESKFPLEHFKAVIMHTILLMALSLPQYLIGYLNFYCVLSCLAERKGEKKTPFNILFEMLVHIGALLIFSIASTVKHILLTVAVILIAEGILHFAKLCLNLILSTALFCALSLNFENALHPSHLTQICAHMLLLYKCKLLKTESIISINNGFKSFFSPPKKQIEGSGKQCSRRLDGN